MEALSSLVLNGYPSDPDRVVVKVKQGRLHLAHRKFSSINANFLPPINDGISKKKEMRERLRVDWVVGGMAVLQLRPSLENCRMLRRKSVGQGI